MSLIVDVSSYQKQVDWKAVLASGRAGAICKATEALGYVDPTFAANWAALGSLGAVRGAYCFARPDKAVPEVTADKFLSVVGPTRPGDILVLDLEVGTGDLSHWALTWLARVEARTGIKPWLYSYAPFIRAHLHDSALAAYPLWLAAYSTKPPAAPPPWKGWTLWQRTDKASVPGISTPCDESIGTIPMPTAAQKVVPMFDPPLALEPVVADLSCPTGGVWLLAASGAVYAFGGAPYLGAPNGKPYFAGRKAAQLRLVNNQYAVVAESGEIYGPGFD